MDLIKKEVENGGVRFLVHHDGELSKLLESGSNCPEDDIDELASKICDDYCRFPKMNISSDIFERICEGCPLDKLVSDIRRFQNGKD